MYMELGNDSIAGHFINDEAVEEELTSLFSCFHVTAGVFGIREMTT